MACAALGRETQHSHLRVDACKVAGSLLGRYGNLSQFLGCGVGQNGAVAEHHDAALAVCTALGQQHDERTTHHLDARSGFQHLECSTQHIASRVLCSGNLTVGITILDEEAAQIQRVFNLLAGIFQSHTLGLAQLIEQLSVRLHGLSILGVDKCCTANVLQTEFFGLSQNLVTVADQVDLCNTFSNDTVGGTQGARFKTLGQNDALRACHCLRF